MQEVLLKPFDLEKLFDASYEVIHNRKFEALTEVEMACNDILDSVGIITDSYATGFLFPIYYIYYCIFNEQDKDIFPCIRKIISLYNERLVCSYPTKEEYNKFFETDRFKEDDVEVKYCYELCMNILNKFDSQGGFSSDKTSDELFKMASKLIKSICNNDYTEICDDFYFIAMMGYDIIDYKKLEPQAYLKLKIKIFESVLSVCSKRGQNSEIDANVEFQEILDQADIIKF